MPNWLLILERVYQLEPVFIRCWVLVSERLCKGLFLVGLYVRFIWIFSRDWSLRQTLSPLNGWAGSRLSLL
jgi:hypothetical protein